MRLHQYNIQISLVAVKYYQQFFGIWEDCIALPHRLGIYSRIAHE